MADLTARVKAELDMMRPYLERSGAEVQLVGVEDGVAKIVLILTRPRTSRMIATLQLAGGIERALRRVIPELRGVEPVNLPPYTLVGWDQPGYGSAVPPAAQGTSVAQGTSGSR